jgi:hypothetical protein
METVNKCTAAMDFSVCWADWRNGLKESIRDSHTYYHDEAVQLLMNKLDTYLTKKVCASSSEEEIMDAMWSAADEKQRETLAALLLKISDQIK